MYIAKFAFKASVLKTPVSELLLRFHAART